VGAPFADGFDDAIARIAGNVRRLRAERGLTQERLAELAELSTVGVAFVEGARTNVTTATLCQLAHALGVDLQVLVAPLESSAPTPKRAVGRPPATAVAAPSKRLPATAAAAPPQSRARRTATDRAKPR